MKANNRRDQANDVERANEAITRVRPNPLKQRSSTNQRNTGQQYEQQRVPLRTPRQHIAIEQLLDGASFGCQSVPGGRLFDRSHDILPTD